MARWGRLALCGAQRLQLNLRALLRHTVQRDQGASASPAVQVLPAAAREARRLRPGSRPMRRRPPTGVRACEQASVLMCKRVCVRSPCASSSSSSSSSRLPTGRALRSLLLRTALARLPRHRRRGRPREFSRAGSGAYAFLSKSSCRSLCKATSPMTRRGSPVPGKRR
jgi:hypothetical protein